MSTRSGIDRRARLRAGVSRGTGSQSTRSTQISSELPPAAGRPRRAPSPNRRPWLPAAVSASARAGWGVSGQIFADDMGDLLVVEPLGLFFGDTLGDLPAPAKGASNGVALADDLGPGMGRAECSSRPSP